MWRVAETLDSHSTSFLLENMQIQDKECIIKALGSRVKNFLMPVIVKVKQLSIMNQGNADIIPRKTSKYAFPKYALSKMQT